LENRKINVAIITGGDSLESISSEDSAKNVLLHLDKNIFNCFLLKLENWSWLLLKSDEISDDYLRDVEIDISDLSLCLGKKKINFDVAFIAIHGAPAENGHLQTYLESVGIPYTGSGSLASAMAMNKINCKEFIHSATSVKIPFGKIINESELHDQKFPCIVKPNSYGSGIGVTLVNNQKSLIKSIEKIRELKQEVLIEEFIEGREITVGAIILENNIQVLPIAEILRQDQEKNLKQNQYYNYTNRQSTEIILDPSIDKKLIDQIKEITKKIGETLNCQSFYRVDYILSKNNEIFFLEINTIPGMTPRSVFVKQIEAASLKQRDIYGKMIIEVMKFQNF
jgi:D-alanine-D-alanine ligase